MGLPDFRLDQRVALVTGAASGIGRRIATGLAEAGADVGCLDLSGPGLDAAKADIERIGRRAVAAAADVTNAADLAAAVTRIESELGPLRLAVNSAGIANAGRPRSSPRPRQSAMRPVWIASG